MNRIRIKILEKLAQTTTSVSGSPITLNIINLNPNITRGYSINPAIINIINDICNQLNIALFYSSKGDKAYDFTTLYHNRFNAQYVGIYSADLKHLVDFSKQVYEQLFKNNSNFEKPLTAQEILSSVSFLENSAALNSLPSTNKSSQLATKIEGGDVKMAIKYYLTAIKQAIPR